MLPGPLPGPPGPDGLTTAYKLFAVGAWVEDVQVNCPCHLFDAARCCQEPRFSRRSASGGITRSLCFLAFLLHPGLFLHGPNSVHASQCTVKCGG